MKDGLAVGRMMGALSGMVGSPSAQALWQQVGDSFCQFYIKSCFGNLSISNSVFMHITSSNYQQNKGLLSSN